MKKSAIAVAVTMLMSSAAWAANDGYVETIKVLGQKPVEDAFSLAEQQPDADASEKLKSLAGANVNRNGGITGIAQYRGLYGDRVAINIDGAQIFSAGPNAMDAPLTYVDGTQLHKLELYRGIAPVSAAQESVGSVIKAKHFAPAFGQGDELSLQGLFNSSYHTVDEGQSLGANLALANKNHRAYIFGSAQEGDDAETPMGELKQSYDKQLIGVGYGYQNDDSEFSISYADNQTDNSISRALPMDIIFIDGKRYSLSYRTRLSTDLSLKASFYGNESEHGMDNYSLRTNMMPDMYRHALAEGEGQGASLALEYAMGESTLSLGVDGMTSEHSTVITNPNNMMFRVANFNKVEDDKVSLFTEWQSQMADWQYELGMRVKRIEADAGEVSHHMAMMNPNIGKLVNNFNNADRSVSDTDVDLVARFTNELGSELELEVAVARKQRAPSYQERYLWIPMQSTGGLADGNTYIGDINLESETATQFELGLSYRGDNFTMSPRAFYHNIDDYIQGVATNDMALSMIGGMMGDDTPLQFANVDAKLYGFDTDFAWRLADDWSLSGTVSYVRGERRDVADDLYRIAPLNGRVAVNYQFNGINTSLEVVGVAKQDKVSSYNQEQKSAGYGLVNLYGRYLMDNGLLVAAGVRNLMDREYQDHLAGINRAMGDEIARGERLPGVGRDVYVSLRYAF